MRLFLYSEDELITSLPLPNEWASKSVVEISNLVAEFIDSLPEWMSKELDSVEICIKGKVNNEIKNLFN